MRVLITRKERSARSTLKEHNTLKGMLAHGVREKRNEQQQRDVVDNLP